jgi:hypothetical protein
MADISNPHSVGQGFGSVSRADDVAGPDHASAVADCQACGDAGRTGRGTNNKSMSESISELGHGVANYATTLKNQAVALMTGPADKGLAETQKNVNGESF